MLEEPRVVAVVVAVVGVGLHEISFSGSGAVRLEDRRSPGERVPKGHEGRRHGIAGRLGRPGSDERLDLMFEPHEQLRLQPCVDARGLVAVDGGVERNEGVGGVVPEHRGPLEHSSLVAGAEGGDELAVHLRDAPGEPSSLGGFGPVAQQVRLLGAGHLAGYEIVESSDVQGVVPVLALTVSPPEVRVDGVGAQEGDVAREELFQRCRQGSRGLLVDEPVDLVAPSPCRRRERQKRDDQEGRPSLAHPGRLQHYCRLSEIEKGRPSRRP